jgi:hypothetical protein
LKMIFIKPLLLPLSLFFRLVYWPRNFYCAYYYAPHYQPIRLAFLYTCGPPGLFQKMHVKHRNILSLPTINLIGPVF